MKLKRFITAALALIMTVGTIIPASITPVFAAYEDKIDDDGKPYMVFCKNSQKERLHCNIIYVTIFYNCFDSDLLEWIQILESIFIKY